MTTRMRRRVGLVVLLAAGVCAWLWARDALRHAPPPDALGVSLTDGAASRIAAGNAVDQIESAAAETIDGPSASWHGEERTPAGIRSTRFVHDDFLVRVRSAEGRPMERVDVSLVNADLPAEGGAGEALRETTDSAGRVSFSGVRARIASNPDGWSLSYDLPAVEPPSTPLDPAALEPEEFDVALPVGGQLEVRVRELDGKPAADGSELRLKLAGESGGDWRLATVNGEAHFPWVELGRVWELTAWRPQGSAPASTRVHGPLRSRQNVRVELVLGVDQPVVSFRAVDPTGRPFATVPLHLDRRRPFGSVARVTVETDADGRFLVDGAADPFDPQSFVVSHVSGDGALHQGRARLPGSPSLGWNDGGDVVIEPWPLLCTGSVLDANGRPVADAEVVAGDGPASFVSDSRVRARTAADGSFELRGMWDSNDFPLHAQRDRNRSDTSRVRQGQAGITLVLTPRFTISGALGVDDGLRLDAVRFQLLARHGAPFEVGRRGDRSLGPIGLHGGWIGRSAAADGADFELEPVPGDVYSLRVLLGATELVQTASFALNQDLHLGTIDLRGRIRTCEIVLVGSSDPAALRGKAMWNVSGSSERHELDFEGGSVRIQTTALPIDVLLLVSGHRAAHLNRVAEHAEVKLHPTIPVTVVLLTSGEIPTAPLAFGCDLRQDGLSVGEPRGARSFDPKNPVLTFDCAAPGKIEVSWRLERSFEGAAFGGAVGGGVLDGHKFEIDVRDDVSEQVFTVLLDGEVLNELVRSPPW